LSAEEHEDQQLIQTARELVRPVTLARPDLNAATVGAALRTACGAVYTGVCIHLSCGLGFCAEAAAVAEMIKGGETRIHTIVAFGGDILPPCGRCREMLAQVDAGNFETRVILSKEGEVAFLKDLLPRHWMNS
jgi:cytidine deaminase